MRAVVLAYHSHNISGSSYDKNDHVALASDLKMLHELGAKFVDAATVAELVATNAVDDTGPPRVALTFDDGPVFDVNDFDHPSYGAQRSFLNLLRDFYQSFGRASQPGLCATSFVIASQQAREAMERSDACGYTYLNAWLSDDWWLRAHETGLIRIGNHSWDHVHEAPNEIVTRDQARGNFALVSNYRDADAEIRAAADFIRSKVPSGAKLFAYPYGHVNEYLVNEYMPQSKSEHGAVAAFGVDGRRVRQGDNVWNIPRATCGDHWHSPDELRALAFG